MKKQTPYYFLLLVFLLTSQLSWSQRSIDTFGKNRVQHEIFDWKYLSSKHFNIYYYQNGERLAHNAARHLENEYERITKSLGMIPSDKIELIIYNSVHDLQQSNIGLRNQDFIGGETSLVKARIEVAFTGSQVVFKNDLVEGVCKKIMEMLLFGGRLKEAVQSSYVLHLPDWFISGAAAYLGHGETPEMYATVYDAIKNNNPDPSKLSGEQARLLGQSYWHFLSEKYGPQAISNVITLTKLSRGEESALASALNLTYERMVYQWKKYYKRKFIDDIDDANESLTQFTDPSRKERVRRRNHKGFVYTDFKFSPDGRYLAYSESVYGKIRVVVKDLVKNRKKTIYNAGYRIVDQKISNNIPIIAWRDRRTVSFVRYKKGKPLLITKSLEKGKTEKKYFETFEEILDFDYSTEGSFMVISGTKKGHSDIFLYDWKRDRARQVTNDLFDDLHPRFVPNSKTIIFSSNRISDTLANNFGEIEDIKNQYDLFSFQGDERNLLVFNRVTNSIINEKEIKPLPSGDYLVRFEFKYQNQIGIFSDSSETIDQVSNFAQSINLYDYNPYTNAISVNQQDKFRQFLSVQEKFPLSITYKEFVKTNAYVAQVDAKDSTSLLDALSEINLDLLQFESDTIDKLMDSDGSIIEEAALAERQKTYGPYKYDGLYSVDYVVTNLLLDPLRGGGILLQGGTGEMFFNHKLNLSLHLLADLRNSNFSVEYEYLKHRVDLKVRYKNDNIFKIDDRNGGAYTYNNNHFEAEIAYPLSPVLRTSITPMAELTRFTQFDFNPNNVDEHNYFGAVRLEMVLDNTKEEHLNLLEGTRFKASVTPYLCTNDAEKNFGKLNIDYRRYSRLYKKLYLATRVGYGAFFGKADRSFLLGGSDNWLFNDTDNTGPGSPLQVSNQNDNTRMLFLDYVTNIRGFNYNNLFGRQYTMLNVELRFPIAQALYSRPIASNFFRNLILIGFYDAGSAWNTGNPFGRDNNINSRDDYAETGSAYEGTVINNYINPFIQSYGFGLRSTLMGYYMKLDFAWPVVNYNTEPLRLFLTLGYDF